MVRVVIAGCLLSLCCISWAAPAGTSMQSSVSKSGITWTFDRAYPVGKFVNGDYFVVGPVVVTNVTRPQGGDSDGSMLNPAAGLPHGFDDSVGQYTTSLNVAKNLPLSLGPNNSLISTISTNVKRPALDKAEVLTVLGSVPDQNDFRPPYVSTSKPMYRWNESRFNQLPLFSGTGLSGVSSGNVNDMKDQTARPYIDHMRGWQQNDYLHPDNNMENYGTFMAQDLNDTMLMTLADSVPVGDRRQLAIQMTQIGIDFYHNALAGTDLGGIGGGIGVGRKAPALYAGWMLQNSAMLNMMTSGRFDLEFFQEDNQLVVLNQSLRNDVNNTSDMNTAQRPDYAWPGLWNNMPDGVPVWVERRNLNTGYPGKWQYVGMGGGRNGPGVALVMLALDLKSNWNYNIFFQWVDLLMSGQVDQWVGGLKSNGNTDKGPYLAKTGTRPLPSSFWNVHRNGIDSGTIGSPPVPGPTTPSSPPQFTVD